MQKLKTRTVLLVEEMRFVKRFRMDVSRRTSDDVSEFVPSAKALKRERDLSILFGCEYCQCFEFLFAGFAWRF